MSQFSKTKSAGKRGTPRRSVAAISGGIACEISGQKNLMDLDSGLSALPTRGEVYVSGFLSRLRKSKELMAKVDAGLIEPEIPPIVPARKMGGGKSGKDSKTSPKQKRDVSRVGGENQSRTYKRRIKEKNGKGSPAKERGDKFVRRGDGRKIKDSAMEKEQWNSNPSEKFGKDGVGESDRNGVNRNKAGNGLGKEGDEGLKVKQQSTGKRKSPVKKRKEIPTVSLSDDSDLEWLRDGVTPLGTPLESLPWENDSLTNPQTSAVLKAEHSDIPKDAFTHPTPSPTIVSLGFNEWDIQSDSSKDSQREKGGICEGDAKMDENVVWRECVPGLTLAPSCSTKPKEFTSNGEAGKKLVERCPEKLVSYRKMGDRKSRGTVECGGSGKDLKKSEVSNFGMSDRLISKNGVTTKGGLGESGLNRIETSCEQQNGVKLDADDGNDSGRGLDERLVASTDVKPMQILGLETQEGVKVGMLDSLVFALDGLDPSSNLLTQQKSAISLINLFSSTQSWKLLDSKNSPIVGTVLRRLIGVLGQQDPILTICAGVLLMEYSVPDSCMATLGSKEACIIIEFLTRQDACKPNALNDPVNSTSSRCKGSNLGVTEMEFCEILRKVMQGDVLKEVVVPKGELLSPAYLGLKAICNGAENHPDSPVLGIFRENMRVHGPLDVLCGNVVKYCRLLEECKPGTSEQSGDPARVESISQKLQFCFDILIILTGGCPENQSRIIKTNVLPEKQSTHTSTTQSSIQFFPAFVASRLPQLGQCFSNTEENMEQNKDKFKSMLGVLGFLMNMAHNDKVGCELVVEGGGMEASVQLLLDLYARPLGLNEMDFEGFNKNVELSQVKNWLVLHGGVVQVLMGLLINLTEDSEVNCRRLLGMCLWKKEGNGNDSDLVKLLVKYMVALDSDGTANESESVRSGDSGVESDSGRVADSARMCVGILLGFLIDCDVEFKEQARELFPCRTLSRVVWAIGTMLSICDELGPGIECNREKMARIAISLVD